jgi:hypothetical protein
MAKLPQNIRTPTVAAIFKKWEEKNEDPRPYLGASMLGKACERQLWYEFRWGAWEVFEGRMLRLFDTGHREEQRLVDDLRSIGVKVWDRDETTGEQIECIAIEGHSGGHLDGVCVGLIEAPKTYHTLELKTMKAEKFVAFKSKGVAVSHPEYYTQFTMYCGWQELTRTFFFARNKDDDDLWTERIEFDKKHFVATEAKARRVIYAAEPPPRITEDATSFLCRFCPAKPICHGQEIAPVNCRTCAHSTPEKDGNARWSCSIHNKDLSVSEQRKGCKSHRYIPALMRYGKLVDADPDANWIEYEITYKGKTMLIRNGDHGLHSYESSELRAAKPAYFFDDDGAKLRAELGGTLSKYEGIENGG